MDTDRNKTVGRPDPLLIGGERKTHVPRIRF